MSKHPTIMISAEIPQHLLRAFLQHLRDFDTVQSGCTFNILATTQVSVDEMIKLLGEIVPPFDVMESYKQN